MDKSELQRLKDLIFLSSELSEVKDFDILMDKILKSARDFIHCDAGSIFVKKGNKLTFGYPQNDTLQKYLEPGRKLIYTTFDIPIDNKSIAGYVALTGKVVNIPDCYETNDRLPFSFDQSYDERTYYRTHSILALPLKTNTGDIIGVLQLINALDEKGTIIPFDPANEPFVAYFANSATNALERALLTRAILLRMIKMTELRDPKETGNHVRRVAGYSVEIHETWAKKKGIPTSEIQHTRDILHMAAMLHDVGKSAISDIILKKNGRLTPEETEIMKQHTVIGAQILSDPRSEYEKAAQIVALNHHERYDGKGYPGYVDPFTNIPIEGYTDENGKPLPKKGNDIPILGRIVALADVYDALSFQRVYKDAWAQERVLELIWNERGKHFDPDVVDAFFDSLLAIRSVAQRNP